MTHVIDLTQSIGWIAPVKGLRVVRWHVLLCDSPVHTEPNSESLHVLVHQDIRVILERINCSAGGISRGSRYFIRQGAV